MAEPAEIPFAYTRPASTQVVAATSSTSASMNDTSEAGSSAGRAKRHSAGRPNACGAATMTPSASPSSAQRLYAVCRSEVDASPCSVTTRGRAAVPSAAGGTWRRYVRGVPPTSMVRVDVPGSSTVGSAHSGPGAVSPGGRVGSLVTAARPPSGSAGVPAAVPHEARTPAARRNHKGRVCRMHRP